MAGDVIYLPNKLSLLTNLEFLIANLTTAPVSGVVILTHS